MSMQKFGREHFLRGNVIALTIPREKEESP